LQYLYTVTSLCNYSFDKNLSGSITPFLKNEEPKPPSVLSPSAKEL
jgi:hypothetical protein